MPNPYEEGSLKEIAKLLLLPVIKAKPKAKSLYLWLDECFGIEERLIKRYDVIKPFFLPGLFYIAAAKTEAAPFKGIRLMKPKVTQLWARIERYKIDIEVVRKGKESEIFSLTPEEFRKISWFIREKPFKERRRTRLTWLKSF